MSTPPWHCASDADGAAASLHLFKDYVPDTSAFKKLSFKNAATWLCEGKLSRARPFYVPQFEQLKALTTPDEHPRLKITMCAPEWYHLRHGEYAYPKSVYANDGALGLYLSL